MEVRASALGVDGDNMERKQADAPRIQSAAHQDRHQLQQIYQAAANAGQMTIWIYDPVTHRVEFLIEAPQMRMYRVAKGIPEELGSPEDMLPLVADESKKRYISLYRQIDAGAEKVEDDIRCHVDVQQGKDYYTHVVLLRLYDESGKFSGVCGVGQDVTQRKVAEHQYRNAFQHLMQLYPSTSGTVQLNLTDNVCRNAEGQDFGKRMQDVRTADDFFEKLSDVVADADTRHDLKEKLTRKNLIEAFFHGRTEFRLEYPFLLENGEHCWRDGVITMLQNPVTGDVEAMACNIDIDWQKRREKVMEKVAQDEFDFVGVLNPRDASFEFYYRKSGTVYSEMQRVDDYDKDRKLMQEAVVTLKDAKRWLEVTRAEHVLQCLRKYGSFSYPYVCVENGITSRRLLRYFWLDEPEGDVLVLHSDVTAVYDHEKRQIRRTQRALKAVEKATKAKSEFVARVSHDIRTPIGLVNSMVGFAFEDIDDRQKLMDDLEKIRSAGTMLLSLVNDVLDIARMDSGKIELHTEPCSYESIVSDIRNVFEPLCRQKRQTFRITGNGAQDFGMLMLDRVRMRQLLLNVVSNAVKYTPKGGSVTLQVNVEPAARGRKRVGIAVTDTGIGMSQEFQKKMFMPFAQEHENPYREKGVESTGLGLPIVKNLAELMQGALEVESEIGQGTTIQFVFEAEPAKEKPDQQPQRKKTEPADLLHGKVLLVEDNEINAELGMRILEYLGLESVWANNGAVALKMFQDSEVGTYDLILMDLQMPIMDGYQATKYIRELRRPDAGKIPIIAMTADSFDDAMENARKSGMDAHLTKPMEPAKLKVVLQSYLE